MRKGILSLLVMVTVVAVASTALAAPKGDVKKSGGHTIVDIQDTDGLLLDDGVID